MEEKDPFDKCATCKVLDDCPEPDVVVDGLGTPMPNAKCKKPIDVMRETLKKHKRKR